MTLDSTIDYFKNLTETVRLAIDEDLGSGDITANLIPSSQNATALVITRENAVVCGRPWFDAIFNQIDNSIKIDWLVSEGDNATKNQPLVRLSGKARSILTAERAALNFLQTLMATATTSRKYMSRVSHSNTTILDTRKTIPGLRLAQKYAVKIGGCDNHRIGLYDAFLIKENHIMACGGIANAISTARKAAPNRVIEIEVESIEELQQAIESGAGRVMLDNFSFEQIEQANKVKTSSVKYEVSGNITEELLSTLSELGVDYISSGALTKHIDAIDLSLRLE